MPVIPLSERILKVGTLAEVKINIIAPGMFLVQRVNFNQKLTATRLELEEIARQAREMEQEK